MHTVFKISAAEMSTLKKPGKKYLWGITGILLSRIRDFSALEKSGLHYRKKSLKNIKNFPLRMIFSLTGNQESIKILYSILTALFVEHNISYAKLQTLEKKREQILKILWTIGFYGVFKKDSLELDARTFLSQKINGMYNYLLEYFKELENAGIHCEIIPLFDKGWLTPMGGLRKEGWFIKLAFGDNLKGVKTLNLFKDYILRLDKKYGKQAFRYFNKADMSIMMN
jgi:hypothetical protein